MNLMKYEYDEALAWQRGINAKRASENKRVREPFYMSPQLLERIKIEAWLKEIEAELTKRMIQARLDAKYAREAEEIANGQQRELLNRHIVGVLPLAVTLGITEF